MADRLIDAAVARLLLEARKSDDRAQAAENLLKEQPSSGNKRARGVLRQALAEHKAEAAAYRYSVEILREVERG